MTVRLQSSVAKVRCSQTLTLTLTFAMIDFDYSGPWLLRADTDCTAATNERDGRQS